MLLPSSLVGGVTTGGQERGLIARLAAKLAIHLALV